MLRRLSDWRIDRMTDRVAPRPSGRRARKVYGAADVHSFDWEPVFDAPQLTSGQELAELALAAGFAVARVTRTDIGAQLLFARD